MQEPCTDTIARTLAAVCCLCLTLEMILRGYIHRRREYLDQRRHDDEDRRRDDSNGKEK